MATATTTTTTTGAASALAETSETTSQMLIASWPDVGILICCLMSVLFRLAIFHKRRRANEQALRECCVVEQRLQEASIAAGSGLTASFAQTQYVDAQSNVSDECYLQFARTVDFAEVHLKEDDMPFDADGSGSGVTSRAEARVLLERALALGVADDNNGANADPVLILLQLPLEQRLMTLVNWFSVISNCLTYYLRPSQVLYTFIFNMVDFFLFAVSVLEARHRCELLIALMRSTDRLLSSAWTAPLDVHPERVAGPPGKETIVGPGVVAVHVPHEMSSTIARRTATAAAAKSTGPAQQAAEVRARPRLARRVTSACVRPVQCAVGGLVAVLTLSVDALQVGLSSLTDFCARRDSSSMPRSLSAVPTESEAVHAPNSQEPQATLNTELTPDEVIEAISRGSGSTGVRELLLLNAALSVALVLFNSNHLFFSVGAVAGYTAGAMNLFLLGCAITNVCSQLCARWRRTHRRPARAKRGGCGCCCCCTSWEVLLSHWFAAACAVFYFFMLLDEGDVLWSTHVNFMRWYAATTALGITEMLDSCGT